MREEPRGERWNEGRGVKEGNFEGEVWKGPVEGKHLKEKNVEGRGRKKERCERGEH